jgi:hypothetical protein
MSAESPTSSRKWFATAAAFAIALAGLAFWAEHRRGPLENSPRPHDKEEPVPLPVSPPIRDRAEFRPPPPEKPPAAEPEKPPPEATPALSSGGGSGPSVPNKSVVRPLPSLWSLLFRPWLLGVAVASIAILGAWQWKLRRKAT